MQAGHLRGYLRAGGGRALSGMDALRERIARAIHDHLPGASCDAYRCRCGEKWTSDHAADAVIAALGLVEVTCFGKRCWSTPWERIEEDV